MTEILPTRGAASRGAVQREWQNQSPKHCPQNMGCAPSKKEPPGAPPPDDLSDAPPPDELPAEEPPDAPPPDELPDAPPPDELPVVELPAEQEQELTLLGSLSQKELLRLFGPPDEAPLPEESTWRENGGVELEALFRCTTLVDARWLLKLAKGEVLPESGGVVPAWQKLPAAAVVTVAQLRTFRRCILACRWPSSLTDGRQRGSQTPKVLSSARSCLSSRPS